MTRWGFEDRRIPFTPERLVIATVPPPRPPSRTGGPCRVVAAPRPRRYLPEGTERRYPTSKIIDDYRVATILLTTTAG